MTRGFDPEDESDELLDRIRRGATSGEENSDSELHPTGHADAAQSGRVIDNVREYQRKIFSHALKRNTICMLGTGLGKTFIAVMLVRKLLADNPGKKALIVCPTAFLVEQQADVFKSNAPYSVGVSHSGRSGRGDWTAERWQQEWSEIAIFVATPQVLVNALNHAYLNLDLVCVVVIDECHHVAAGDHPMRQLMRRVREMSVAPRVLGLTASPLLSTPSKNDFVSAIALLEAEMADSKLITANVGDVFNPPEEQVVDFDSLMLIPSDEAVAQVLPESLSLSAAKSRKKLLCFLTLWQNVSATAARRYYRAQCEAAWGGDAFRNEICTALEQLKVEGFREVTRPTDTSDMVAGDYTSPKLDKLLEILRNQTNLQPSEQVVVFVELRDMAYQLSIEIEQRSSLSADWLIGISSKQDVKDGPRKMLERFCRFKAGQITVLVATSAAEEGIDVPGVSTVISYDGVKQMKSYVQMRGRCRFSMSRYFVFNATRVQRKWHLKAKKTEQDLYDWLASRPSDVQLASTSFLEETDATDNSTGSVLKMFEDQYVVESSGAVADQHSAVGLVFRFAVSLMAQDSVSISYPQKRLGPAGVMFVGVMKLSNYLPLELRTFVSSARASKKDCKRECCMRAIAALHQRGWLTDRLLPMSAPSFFGVTDEKNAIEKGKTTEMAEICSALWKSASLNVYLVAFGDFALLKLSLPFDLAIGQEILVTHPVVGNVVCRVVEECSASFEPSKEELACSDLLWSFLDPEKDSTDSNFFVSLANAQQLNQTMDAYKNRSALQTGTLNEEFLLESKADRGSELFAVMGKSLLTPRSLLLSDSCSGSFESHFQEKLESFSPSEEARDRPMMRCKSVRQPFRARHFSRDAKVGRYREHHIPHYTVSQFWMLRNVFFALECLPTFVRFSRLAFSSSRVIAGLFPLNMNQSVELHQNVCCALSPLGAGYGSQSLERFEFVGDSLLKLFTTRRLYEAFPYSESWLTESRTTIVGNYRLSQVFLNSPLLCGAVDPRSVAQWKHQECDSVSLTIKGAADVVEAIFGAVYLSTERNLELVENVAERLGVFSNFPQLQIANTTAISDESRIETLPFELRKLESVIGWSFRNPLLLLEATTHPTDSQSVVRNYNRLELLGDAVVDLAIVMFALDFDNCLNPAGLSNWRYACGSTEALGRISKRLGLAAFIRHFDSSLTRELDRYCFVDNAPTVWLDETPKEMADIFEALVGAVYVDSGYDSVKTLALCRRLASPTWESFAPNPPMEPTRELRERLEQSGLSLTWDVRLQAVLCEGYVLASSGQSRNWNRMSAWKATQCLKFRPQIINALLLRKQQSTRWEEWSVVAFPWLLKGYAETSRGGEVVLEKDGHFVFLE